jgi:hypothetical protein
MILLSLDLTSWSSASALPRPQLVDTYRTRSYKKDDEPLLNLAGAMSRCSREKKDAYVYTKEGTRVPYLNTRGLVCT